MVMLVLNKRRILGQLLDWFPRSRDDLVVVTARPATSGLDPRLLRERLRHLEVVDDYDGAETERLAARLCRAHGARLILTTSETDVVRAAHLRRRLGIPGQDVASATAYRDKFAMKSIAAAAGIPVAPMRIVSTEGEAAEFAREHGFPIVVKLPAGKGSIGQSVLSGWPELARFAARWRAAAARGEPKRLLAEGWIDAHMYHVDGLMDGGRVLHCWPSRYLHSQWATMHDSAPFISGMLPRGHEAFSRLRLRTAAVVAALPPPPGLHPFHAEFFQTGDGEIVLCEIACRVGGGRIVEAYQRAFGVNLYEAGLKGQAGRGGEIRASHTGERFGFASFAPLRGVLRDLPRTCPLPGVVAYSATGVPGRAYPGARSSTDEVASALIRLCGDDLLAELRSVEDWWTGSARWDVAAQRADLCTRGRAGRAADPSTRGRAGPAADPCTRGGGGAAGLDEFRDRAGPASQRRMRDR